MLCKGQLTYEECPWFEPFLKVVTALFVDRVLSTKRKRHAQTEWPHWGSLCTSCFTARCNQCDSIVWSGTLLLFKVPLGSCLHHFEKNHPYIRYSLQYACHMERVQSERVVRKVLSTHKFQHITRENNPPQFPSGRARTRNHACFRRIINGHLSVCSFAGPQEKPWGKFRD
jgi:hypothetical protein